MADAVIIKKGQPCLKGVVIQRALPENLIDVYALVKEASKEGLFKPFTPTPQEMLSYSYVRGGLADELGSPHSLIYLAKRGRGFFGYIHAQLVFRPLINKYTCMLNTVYIVPKKRKLGIGRALITRLKEDCKRMGIGSLELLCEDEMVPYYEKQSGKKERNLMVMEIK